MIQEFERSKEQVSGRSVMITSWFDTDSGSWRAGAPAHSYVAAIVTREGATYTSRRSAIERTVGLLISGFKEEDARAGVR